MRGADIPLLGRVVHAADSFEAMTVARSYQAARPLEAAIDELLNCAGTQFDPLIVDAFIMVLRREGRKLLGPQVSLRRSA